MKVRKTFRVTTCSGDNIFGYPDLPVLPHGDEAMGDEEVKCHHCQLVPNIPDVPQQLALHGVLGVHMLAST